MSFYTKNKEGFLVEIPMGKVETLLNNDVKVYSDKDLISELTLQKEKLQEENKILREALEYYAKRMGSGGTAREALAKVGDK